MNNRNKNHHQTVISTITVYGFLASILLISIMFSGCERLQQTVLPADPESVPIHESNKAIKIGFLYSTPIPGTTLNGAQLAVSELNDTGGVDGMPIVLIPKDDTNDTQRSVELAQKLIAEGVLGIVGPDWSPHALEVGPVVQAAKIPMVTTYPTNPTVPDAGDFVFMGAFTDNYQGELIARFAVESLSATSAYILTQNDNAYSVGLSQFFIGNFLESAAGVEVLQQFYTAGSVNFTAQLTEIAAMSPDVVFLPGFVPEVPLVVKQAREAGITATFIGGDGWDSPELIPTGGAALEGSFFVNHFAAQNEEASHFVMAYTEMFGIPPDGPASLGYDAVRILVQAMQRADSLTTSAIRNQLAATLDYNGAAKLSHYNEKRQPIKSGVITTITNGEMRLHQVVSP